MAPPTTIQLLKRGPESYVAEGLPVDHDAAASLFCLWSGRERWKVHRVASGLTDREGRRRYPTEVRKGRVFSTRRPGDCALSDHIAFGALRAILVAQASQINGNCEGCVSVRPGVAPYRQRIEREIKAGRRPPQVVGG